jgi:hypothetical protein
MINETDLQKQIDYVRRQYAVALKDIDDIIEGEATALLHDAIDSGNTALEQTFVRALKYRYILCSLLDVANSGEVSNASPQ